VGLVGGFGGLGFGSCPKPPNPKTPIPNPQSPLQLKKNI